MFNILQQIMLSHPFLMSRNFKTQGCQCYTDSNGLNLFSCIRRIVEQGLGYFFISSSRSHFFNKTHFERYLFKTENRI